jgi:hypothetical protein
MKMARRDSAAKEQESAELVAMGRAMVRAPPLRARAVSERTETKVGLATARVMETAAIAGNLFEGASKNASKE